MHHKLWLNGRVSLVTWCSFLAVMLIIIASQHPCGIIFINESMDVHSALMNSGFSVRLPRGAAHFESFEKSTQSRYSALALSHSSPFSHGALHFSSPLSAWTLLVCSVMAKQYFCMGNKQSGVFSLSFWRGALHHMHIALQRAPFYQCLLYLYLILPLCSSLYSPQKYTHPGLMHFIKVATCAG